MSKPRSFLRVCTETLVQFPATLKSDLYFSIFEAFTEAGIEMPFPQRDIHLRSIDREAWAGLREAKDSGGRDRSGDSSPSPSN